MMVVFRVDQECIGCDTCPKVAGEFFQLTPNKQLAVMVSQPQTQDDISLCRSALKACPVFAILEKKI